MGDSALYLKRLDIYGFKSFGERTRLEFTPGITAVVGPNGSGKSNIADAVRWVLGEQSAKSLRGAKMEDVIFGGSDGRRRLGYAEVSLTVDNTDGYLPLDFSEVTITRRVYRSGESQYFINQVQCRLKDVQELFMDTGLGKDTYALIGQGQIDQVLNARPEERRQIIEEAAGIVKYRTRRTQAQRKLEDTQQHLFRVNDVIAEIERQLFPLEKEAEKARQYLRLTEELKNVELAVYAAELELLRSNKEEAANTLTALQSDLAAILADNSRLEADIAEQKKLVSQTEEVLEKKSAAVQDLNEKLTSLTHDRSLALAQITNLEERRGEGIEELRRLQSQVAEYETALSKVSQELQVLDEQIVRVEKSKEEIEQKTGQFATNLKEREAVLATLEKEAGETAQRLAKLQQTLLDWSDRRHSLLRQKQALLERCDQYEVERVAAQQTVSDLVANYEAITKQLKALEETLNLSRQELEHRQLTQKQLTARYQKLANEQQNLQSRLKILKEMEAEYEGYSQAVKSVMQAAKQERLTGIVGTVAELLEVPNDLVTAIETALGGSLQSIVTGTREQAEMAIQFLKTSGAGRATFLPLDGLWSSSLSDGERRRLQEIPGYVGVADELVKYHPEHQAVVKYLLGRVIITDDMKSAIAVSQVTRRFSRIVTRDGDQISPGGAMTGGSAPKNKSAGLLTRRHEREELANQSRSLGREMASVKNNLAALEAEIARLHEQETVLQEEKHGLEIQLAATARDLANARELRERILSQHQQQQAEVSRVDEELANLEERILVIEQEIKEIEKQQEIARVRIEELRAELDSLRKEHTESDQAITAYLVELAGLKEKRQSLLSRGESVKNQLQQLDESLRRRQQELDELQSRIETAKSQVNAYDQTLAVVKTDIEKAQIEEQQLKEILKSYRQRLDNLLEQLESGRNAAGLVQIKLNDAQRRMDKVNLQESHLVEKLAVDYGLTPEQLQRTVTPTDDLAASRQRVKMLRDEVKKIGTVNLNAADEYAALKERYDFLTVQREDLVNAMRSLQKVIDELDQVSKEKFMGTFARVRHNFQVVFEQLFGGGTCDLILIEGDESSPPGLEIVAQPPGKKLQTLSLLSGGERALTALSFLFALLEERPSPFCVLDEVDSALDDSNLVRFGQLLRAYSDNTQFLVITHRQTTMEFANVLYGVTMGKDGISKLVSVKLSDEVLEEHVDAGQISS